MKNLFKLAILITLIFTINSCGRRGSMDESGQEIPKFDKVLDPGVN